MCCKIGHFNGMKEHGMSSCPDKSDCGFFSKKKKIEYLQQYIVQLEEKAADIKEYINELLK